MKEIDVFISANSSDFHSAGEVFDFLEESDIAVFFSERSLPKLGISDYRKEIDKALELAKHMVVVTSSRDNVESSWVEAEWGIFVNEKRSDRKKGNIITIVTEGCSIEQLPTSLRYYEVMNLDKDGLKKLLSYLTVDKDKNEVENISKPQILEEGPEKGHSSKNLRLNKTLTDPGAEGKCNTKGRGKLVIRVFAALLTLVLIGSVFFFNSYKIEKAKQQTAILLQQEAAERNKKILEDERLAAVAKRIRLENEAAAKLQAEKERKQATMAEQSRKKEALKKQAEKTAIEKERKLTAEKKQKKEAAERKRKAALAAQKKPSNSTSHTDPTTGMEFVLIPGDCFHMGSPSSEPGWARGEGPVHKVCIESFYMGKYEVTQGEYQKITGTNPSSFKSSGSRFPVEGVSRNDAQGYIKKINSKSVKSYRLPTEAEWEYAARGGTTTPFYFGNTISTSQANYNGNYTYNGGQKGKYRKQTTQAGTFNPNKYGLHDMHGNVWEWCQDWYGKNYYTSSPSKIPLGPASGSHRVIRGGSWNASPRDLRSAHRRRVDPNWHSSYLGFRLVLPVLQAEQTAIENERKLNAKKKQEEQKHRAAKIEKLRIEKEKAAKVEQQRLALKKEAVGQREAANAKKLRIEKEKANKKRSYTDSVTSMEFVFIPAGCFNIDRNGKELCVNAVYMGKYEVTQKQYVKITDQNPSKFDNTDQHPVESVNWDAVQIFIGKLNSLSGKRYRLPTETEWEYAATGGVLGLKQREYAGSDSSNEVAWFVSNANKSTHAVGLKSPNEFGLYDMSGNVWEWCSDWYEADYYNDCPRNNPIGPSDGSSRVIRGGSWLNGDQASRSVHRDRYRPWRSKSHVGFRLVISADMLNSEFKTK